MSIIVHLFPNCNRTDLLAQNLINSTNQSKNTIDNQKIVNMVQITLDPSSSILSFSDNLE